MEGTPKKQYLENATNQVERNTLIGNIMQAELARIHEEAFDKFLETHAEGFRNLMDANPELIDEFEKDPETTLAKISETIYH